MSAVSDLADIVRNCDTAFLDDNYDTDATADDIADQLYAAVRAEVLVEAADVADSSSALFEGRTDTAAAAGAMEGLAVRLRRMAGEKTPADTTQDGAK